MKWRELMQRLSPDVSPDTIPGLSRFQQTILHQTRIEKHLIDNTIVS